MTAIDDGVKTKVCRICGAEKPLTDFYTHKSTRDGRQTFCIQCSKDRGKINYERKKKGDLSLPRSVRFANGNIQPSELTDEEILGGFIYEEDGSKTDSAWFEDRVMGRFNKELSRRLNRYIKQKSARAIEIIFEIADSDLVEPADRLKAATWLAERIVGKTPEVLQLGVEQKPYESVFENLVGGSREEHRAKQLTQAIDAEVVSVDGEVIDVMDQDPSEAYQTDSDLGQQVSQRSRQDLADESQFGSDQTSGSTNDDQNTGNGIHGGQRQNSSMDSNKSTEQIADEIVSKKEEAQALKKRIADAKRLRFAARVGGATSLARAPWLIDWRVDEEGLRACLVAPEAQTPAKLAVVTANDEATNDLAFVAQQRANILQAKADKLQEKANKMLGRANGAS